MNARILSARKVIAGMGLAAGSVVAGSAIASATTASAATVAATTPASDTSSSSATSTAPGTGSGSTETALTGSTLTKVRVAVAAKYPGATFDRVTTDSDGVYEADITTKDGAKVTVEVNAAFVVTGTETRPAGGHGGGGGNGEIALTGSTLTKVKAAVAAKYPGATFDRVTTDNDGVYEADITTNDGAKVTVEVNAAFVVTGLETRPADGHGGAAGGTAPTGTAPAARA